MSPPLPSRQSEPAVTLVIRADARPFRRGVKTAEAAVHAVEKPLSIPTAQEIVMRQELGEFDV